MSTQIGVLSLLVMRSDKSKRLCRLYSEDCKPVYKETATRGTSFVRAYTAGPEAVTIFLVCGYRDRQR